MKILSKKKINVLEMITLGEIGDLLIEETEHIDEVSEISRSEDISTLIVILNDLETLKNEE